MTPVLSCLVPQRRLRRQARRTVVVGIGLVLGSAMPGSAQLGTGTELPVEVAAARYVLARATGHGVRLQALTLDPAFADSSSAPGHPGRVQRDSTRTAALAVAVGARVAVARDSLGVHLLLSEPTARGDTAAVTVTITWPDLRRGRGLVGYETVALTLARERGGWRVVRARQLGIT